MTMMRHLLYPVPSDACDIRIATAVFPFPRMSSIRSRWNTSKDKKEAGGVVWRRGIWDNDGSSSCSVLGEEGGIR